MGRRSKMLRNFASHIIPYHRAAPPQPEAYQSTSPMPHHHHQHDATTSSSRSLVPHHHHAPFLAYVPKKQPQQQLLQSLNEDVGPFSVPQDRDEDEVTSVCRLEDHTNTDSLESSQELQDQEQLKQEQHEQTPQEQLKQDKSWKRIPPIPEHPCAVSETTRRCVSLSEISLSSPLLKELQQQQQQQDSTSETSPSCSSSSELSAPLPPRPRPQGPPRRSVSFSNLEIRSYKVIVGDHPYCSAGCSVTLDWHYDSNTQHVDVDEFEAQRSPRRSTRQLKLSAQERHARLLADNCHPTDLRRASRKLQRARSVAAPRVERKNMHAFFHGA